VHRDGPEHRLVARGRLTAAGGELLCNAITTTGQRNRVLVADLSAVTQVELAGWGWLLPAMRHCQFEACRLTIVPPAECEIEPDAGRAAALEPPAAPPEPAQLRCYPDGPVIVRGDVELLGRDGAQLPRTRSVMALCRCGASAIKPFCDGSHKVVGFTDG